eukprot:gene22361-28955_t
MSSISVVKKTFNRLFSVIWILSACAIFVPLLFPDVQYRLAEISQAGIFGKTLRTSVLLKIFEGVSIGSTLPSLVNIFLDKISHASSKSELGSHYFSLLVMFGTGIVYLSCYDNDFTPYFYASSFCIKLQTLCSVVMYSALNGVIATEHKLHPVMFMLPTLTFAVLQIFVSFSLLFPEYKSLSAVRIPLYSFCVLVFFVCKVIWFYKLWCHYRINNYILEFEVKKEAIHMSTLWIFAIAFMAVNSIDNPSENIWINTNETILVVYCSLYVASSIVLTILPNRFIRTEATAAADPSESKHPVYDLQDDLLVKKIGGYLRVEVADSGAGILSFCSCSKTFTLAGVAENDRAPVTDCGSSSLLATVSNSFSVISPPSPSCVFPEEAWYSSNGGADADIEMAVPRPQILIVDDSSANR